MLFDLFFLRVVDPILICRVISNKNPSLWDFIKFDSTFFENVNINQATKGAKIADIRFLLCLLDSRKEISEVISSHSCFFPGGVRKIDPCEHRLYHLYNSTIVALCHPILLRCVWSSKFCANVIWLDKFYELLIFFCIVALEFNYLTTGLSFNDRYLILNILVYSLSSLETNQPRFPSIIIN